MAASINDTDEWVTTEAENKSGESPELMAADIDNVLVTTDIVNVQAIANYDDVSFSILVGNPGKVH